jgi:hypothetical protein
VIAADTAQAASEALWCAMVELAETANDEVVAQQRNADAAAVDNIAVAARDLATLANAASVLARFSGQTTQSQP